MFGWKAIYVGEICNVCNMLCFYVICTIVIFQMTEDENWSMLMKRLVIIVYIIPHIFEMATVC